MPLSSPAPRESIHVRRIECRGFRRSDGLWDIEGHMTDVKSYAFTNPEQHEVKAGDPVHDMWLRLTVDDTLAIQAIEAVTDSSPFRICPDITPNFQRLIGLRLDSGYRRRAAELVGGAQGCTHLVELLGPMATTAFQTIAPILHRERAERAKAEGKTENAAERPRLLDTCYAFGSTSPVVKRRWPAFYTGD
jgi:hypothetical protein